MARQRDEDDYDDRPRRDWKDAGDDRRLSAEDLRTVAWSQKIIIFCILGYLCTLPLRFALEAMPTLPAALSLLILAGFYLAVGITATVFVFRMSITVYSTGTGVLYGLLTLLPCIGLIMLLVINAKATGILQKNGVRVGLLGANMSDLPAVRRDDDEEA